MMVLALQFRISLMLASLIIQFPVSVIEVCKVFFNFLKFKFIQFFCCK